jgi:cytochrome c peroxidase
MKQLIILFSFASIISIVSISFATQNDYQQKSIRTKAQLGKMLFSEKILSLDSSVSCASCHIPSLGFADTVAFSKGINNTPTLRNTPSVLNMKNRPYFFWDGRANTLEQQSLMPIEHPHEMALPIEQAIERLNNQPIYVGLFKKIFKAAATKQNIAAAFAAYEKTLETSNSLFDKWSNNEAGKKWTKQMERGRALFVSEKTHCFDCHFKEDFTADEFRNIGLFDGQSLNDSGRYMITKNKKDIGKFKTPGLRNVAITAPYMHNGMFKTLEEVIDYYDNPKSVVANSINMDPVLLQPLHLTQQEKADLVVFLKTLTDEAFEKK